MLLPLPLKCRNYRNIPSSLACINCNTAVNMAKRVFLSPTLAQKVNKTFSYSGNRYKLCLKIQKIQMTQMNHLKQMLYRSWETERIGRYRVHGQGQDKRRKCDRMLFLTCGVERWGRGEGALLPDPHFLISDCPLDWLVGETQDTWRKFKPK